MLNNTQKVVFKSIADNKAQFECLKEFILGKFDLRTVPRDGTNEFLGQIARTKIEGTQAMEEAFNEIYACRTQPVREKIINQAR